jgi:hypothetical protein
VSSTILCIYTEYCLELLNKKTSIKKLVDELCEKFALILNEPTQPSPTQNSITAEHSIPSITHTTSESNHHHHHQNPYQQQTYQQQYHQYQNQQYLSASSSYDYSSPTASPHLSPRSPVRSPSRSQLSPRYSPYGQNSFERDERFNLRLSPSHFSYSSGASSPNLSPRSDSGYLSPGHYHLSPRSESDYHLSPGHYGTSSIPSSPIAQHVQIPPYSRISPIPDTFAYNSDHSLGAGSMSPRRPSLSPLLPPPSPVLTNQNSNSSSSSSGTGVLPSFSEFCDHILN